MKLRSTAVAAVAAAAGVLVAAPASPAFDVPQCNVHETYARPGLDRSFEMYCSFTDEVEIVRAPEHGQLTGLAIDAGGSVSWRYRPRDGAPLQNSFTVALSGPAGTLEHRVRIVTVPREINTAPVCEPVRHAERTDGAGSAEVEFHVWCRDEEADELTIEGGGPGEHLSTPIRLPGGVSGGDVPRMRYRTAVAAGSEQATHWATDVLGARGPEAPIDITVGPSVDRLPECRPNPATYGEDAFPIFARPGLARRFAIVCEDADGDDIEPRVVDRPRRGTIAGFVAGPQRQSFWGSQRWVDTTYQPASSYEDADRFTVRADGPKGAGPEAAIAIYTAAPPSNSLGGGCGSSSTVSVGGAPAVIELFCIDEDGDRLAAAVTEGPLHGIAGVPAVTTGLYGTQEIRIPYEPAPGFEGVDVVEVTVTDGYGYESAMPMAVYVDPLPPPPAPAPPGGAGPPLPPGPGGARWIPADPARPLPSPLGVSDAPDAGRPAAVAPRDQARSLLGLDSLRLAHRIGSARLYAPAGQRRGVLALTCALECRARIERRLPAARGARASRSPRLATRRVTAGPSQGAQIDVGLTAAERRAARRAGRRSLSVRVVVVDAAGVAGAARLRLPVR